MRSHVRQDGGGQVAGELEQCCRPRLAAADAELVQALAEAEGADRPAGLAAGKQPGGVAVVAEGCVAVAGRCHLQREGGCRAEISSVGELQVALDAGYPASDCLYTGPGKTDAEVDEAIGAGVRTFSVESPSDLRHMGAAAVRQRTVADCLLRINSPASAGSTGIRLMGRPSQFGIDSDTLAAELPELIQVPGTRLAGAHFFTMSNATDEEALLAEYTRVIELAATLERDIGLPLELLDIGGGFAAPYAVPGTRTPYPRLRRELTRIMDERLPRWRTGSPRLARESGRYLVAECGILVSRVMNVKDSRSVKFIILDAGINALGGPSGLGRLLPVAVQLDSAGTATQPASLVGPLCTRAIF